MYGDCIDGTLVVTNLWVVYGDGIDGALVVTNLWVVYVWWLYRRSTSRH